MAFDFPSAPTNGQIVTLNGATYIYNTASTRWEASGRVGSTVATTQPATPTDGELWYNTATDTMFVYEAGTTTWQPIGGPNSALSSQASAVQPTTRPDGSALQAGDLWYDTTNQVLKAYDGSTFDQEATGNVDVQAATAAPTVRSNGQALVEGDLYFNSTDDTLYAWNGAAWTPVGPPPFDWQSVAGSPITLATSTRSGGGALVDGDQAWDSVGDQLYVWSGTAWNPTNSITSNTTLYVATTGNDTTGLGTAAAPWATPHKAMAYLSNYAIAQGVTVTVSVADGAYTFTTPLNLNHPDGDRIFINGGTTSGVRPTGAALNGGGVDNTPATEAFNDALLKAYYNTQWQFNGCHGLVCSTGGNVTVNTVLIRGDASSLWNGVIAGNYDATDFYASSGGINLGDTVAVHNFGGNGISTVHGGSIKAESATASNNGNYGIATIYGGSIAATGATASNNVIYGILTIYGGSIKAESTTASNNGNSGIATYYGGSIYALSAIASNNSFCGILTYYGGSINAQSATASNNTSAGISTSYGGSIYANSATATGNGSTDVLADRAGIIQVTGATYGTISPAVNTVGNLNAATST